MKTLITLSVLQTVGIAALMLHTFREEHGPDSQPASAASSPFGSPASTISSSSSSTFGAATSEERLRAIIRDELTRAQSERSAAVEAAPATLSRPRDPALDQQRREAVAEQIENYRAAGAITDAQMQELQADIARLDDASRKQMMSRLVRALNSGDIKGRF